jgi:PAS domain S-box-containing protein
MELLNRVETEFKFDLFFELSPDLLCIAGYDGYFKKVNSAVSEKLGFSLQELYAEPINRFIHPQDQLRTSAFRKEIHKSKPLHYFENRYVTKEGEIIWLSWTSLPIESDQLVFAIAKDITHQKQMEEDRNILLAELSGLNKGLKNLSYTTSHDIRSPVNNMLALLTMIDTSKIEDTQTIKLIEFVKISGQKLKNTLDKHLDALGKLDKPASELKDVCFNDCLKKVLASIAALVSTTDTSIETDFTALQKVKFKSSYLQSIFLNLITNAIKYARPGFPARIKINTQVVQGVPHLIFSDNGLGFDLEKVGDKIFGLHQKFHGNTDSKGVGLYLVYTHITSLGGRITVESEVNKGTTFTIMFKQTA